MKQIDDIEKRLVYNWSVIFIALIVAIATYPSTLSMIAVVITTVGFLDTLNRIVKISDNKALSKMIIGIITLAAFVLVFYFIFIS